MENLANTHLKFNIAPEKLPSQKECNLPTIIFSEAMLNFGGCKFEIFYKPCCFFYEFESFKLHHILGFASTEDRRFVARGFATRWSSVSWLPLIRRWKMPIQRSGAPLLDPWHRMGLWKAQFMGFVHGVSFIGLECSKRTTWGKSSIRLILFSFQATTVWFLYIFVHGFKFPQCKLNHFIDLQSNLLFLFIGLLGLHIQLDNLYQISWIADIQ